MNDADSTGGGTSSTPPGSLGEVTPTAPVPTAPADSTPMRGLSDRITSLAARLENPPRESERTPLREELVGLVREIDSTMNALREMRESLKPLAERYKQLYPRPAPTPPQVVDHLGASTYRERGWSALAAGAYEEAVRQLRTAIDRDPSDPAAPTMLAWSYLHLGRDVDAARLLERAMAGDAARPLTRTIAGLSHLRGGRAELATGMLRTVAYGEAGADRTARMYAHLYLGLALSGTGQREEGRAEVRRALEIGPNLTEAWWELGRLHAADGDRDSALEAWRSGAENRFSGWGERCRAEAERLAAEEATDATEPGAEESGTA